MNALPATRPPFEIRGRHVFLGVFTFFAVVVAVDMAFLVMAYRTFPGQSSVTPYEDGLLYNNRIAQLEAQDRLGWKVGAAAEPDRVVLIYQDRNGAPLSGLSITGRLERPATETGRLALTFSEAAPGRYVAPAKAATGAWDLTVDARGSTGGAFTAERRLTWR